VNGVVLAPALPEGAVAYVDRDWLSASSDEAPSLVATPDGALAWCGGPPVRIPRDLDHDMAAALVLLAVAHEAAAAVEGVPGESIEVTGSGLIARQVRALVGDHSAADRRSTPIEQPKAIVETTGDPSVILDATQRAANLGTVVLLGESLGRTAEMNLYPDVHVRGLTLVGVAPPLEHADASLAQTDADDPLIASSREALVGAIAGTPLPPDATWYRVSTEAST
jgi:threonine dehydrogenase-like Zn-dependent dehydrogenase